MKLIITDIDIDDRTLLEDAARKAEMTLSLETSVDSVDRESAAEALKSSLNSDRGQHRASDLLNPFLRNRRDGSLEIIVTSSDIYTGKLYYIFGLALPPRGAGLVSIYRLRGEDRSVLLDRLIKEIVHETGHILGLEHCSNPECVMRFSNTLTHTDRKSWKFCPACSKRLETVYG